MTANLLDFDLEGLAAFCEQLGEKRFRAVQLFRWIHQKGASDFDRDDRSRAQPARETASRLHHHRICLCFRARTRPTAPSNGCSMWVVAMRWKPCSSRKKTAAPCAFRPRPVVLWVAVFAPPATRAFRATSPPARSWPSCGMPSTSCASTSRRTERVITNVVMMGMGEPLQNYNALVPALRVMLDDHGYGLSRRRVTVSTSGVVPMMDRLAQDVPGGAGRVAARAQRCAAQRSGAAQPQVPDRRAAGRLPALTCPPRRATSSLSSTACSTASTTSPSTRRSC